MSVSVLPALPAGWPIIRTDEFSTRKYVSISGKETAVADWTGPRYTWEQTYEVLRQSMTGVPMVGDPWSDMATLMGFYELRLGGFDSFLYADQDDFATTSQPFGTGDGVTAVFQLTRSFGGSAIPVLAPHAVTDVKVSGSTQTLGTGAAQYNVTLWGGTYLSGGGASTDPPGSVRFGASAIPAAAAPLTWDGTYYFPVRFVEDKCIFEKFLGGRYTVKKLTWKSIK